ncbi:MAG: hypothetical protein JRH20_32785 [Deltaproteobacteria bacterium]|nr:hypothetical protein [Deltaproteobacteria bacterium]
MSRRVGFGHQELGNICLDVFLHNEVHRLSKAMDLLDTLHRNHFRIEALSLIRAKLDYPELQRQYNLEYHGVTVLRGLRPRSKASGS